jgi:hypothetical protein
MAKRFLSQLWQIASSVDTVIGISGWGVWKGLAALAGALAGAAVSWLSAVEPWAWFLLIMAGIGGALFIANEAASLRLRKRLPRQDTYYCVLCGQIEGGQTSCLFSEGIHEMKLFETPPACVRCGKKAGRRNPCNDTRPHNFMAR